MSAPMNYDMHDVDDKPYRRVVIDMLLYFGRKPNVSSHLFSDFDVSRAKEVMQSMADSGQHITMTAILIKCIALAQKDHPISRTIPLPVSRQATLERIVAGFTVERFIDSQPTVLFGEIDSPHEKTVAEITSDLHDYHQSDMKELPVLEQQLKYARLPWPLRRLIVLFGSAFPSFRLRYMRSTFGLSSLGALGVGGAAGPAVCTVVFGIGAIEERVVIVDHALTIKPMMTVSLNYDQRVMDEAQAARFLQSVQNLVENGAY